MPRISDPLDRFGTLADVERECVELREAACTAAEDCTARAARAAAAVLRGAWEDAAAVRVETAARSRAAGEEELAGLLARAAEEAAAVRARTAQRLPELVARVLAHVRIELSVLVGDEVLPGEALPGGAEAPR
jgi:hypothetical protein